MDGNADHTWFNRGHDARAKATAGTGELPRVRPERKPWFHEHLCEKLPFPSQQECGEMHDEAMRTPPNSELGPACHRWHQRVLRWAHSMERKYQPVADRLTGNWRAARARWDRRLRELDAKRYHRLMSIVAKGGKFPFNVIPSKPMHTLRNHPRLAEKSNEVWRTVKEQLREATIVPYDTRGAITYRGRLLRGRLPLCMWSTAWRLKKHTDKVRITHNIGPLKAFFRPEDVAVELETIHKLRWKIDEGDFMTGTDVHSAFFSYLLHPSHRKFTGHSYHASELPDGVARRLADAHSQSVVRIGRNALEAEANFARGDFRICFIYRGLPMGASPSVLMLQEVYGALIETWRLCPIGRGPTLEQWRATLYVDDAGFFTRAAHYANACELTVRVLFEMVLLGFKLSFHKCSIVPLPWMRHLGFILDARSGEGCTISLPPDRAANIKRTVDSLAMTTAVGRKVPLLEVAAVVGTLWSIHVVCHRAVAVMCRPLIYVLAVALRIPAIRLCSEACNLSRLLKRVWKGRGIWTRDADAALKFWSQVPFERLRAHMRCDASTEAVKQWVSSPDGTVADDIMTFCADTSDSGSGASRFELYRDGKLWKPVPGTQMFALLTQSEVQQSSCYRELLGVERMDMSVVPKHCMRAVIVCDSRAAISCLERGSSIPTLQAVVQRIFLKHLTIGRVATFCWRRRDTHMVSVADAISRWDDSCAHQIDARTFWRTNDLAIELWGIGLQLDLFADFHNVVPPDSNDKLPFFSRFRGPHTSGVDAFAHHWLGCIVWAYPPFALIPRLLAAFRNQKARGALVFPRKSKRFWASQLRTGSEGILKIIHFDAPLLPGRSVYHAGFSVAMVDFSTTVLPTTPHAAATKTSRAARAPCPQYRTLTRAEGEPHSV